jgi:hypothetical protein
MCILFVKPQVLYSLEILPNKRLKSLGIPHRFPTILSTHKVISARCQGHIGKNQSQSVTHSIEIVLNKCRACVLFTFQADFTGLS